MTPTFPPARRAALLLSTAILLFAGEALAANGSLSGTILDQASNSPIAGVTIEIEGPAKAKVTSDATGAFSFSDLPPGTYELKTTYRGKPVQQTITIQDGKAAVIPVRVSASPASAAEELVIQAQRSSTQVARRVQEEAPNLIDVQTYEEIRKLPDISTAEAVRRIPGISMETDEGEGRYINIRGFDADLNSTTFSGVHLLPTNNASPFGGYRAMALDSLPIGFIGGITLTKSNTPNQDAEALGGTIDITPKTAPGDGKPFLEGDIGGGYEPLRNTPRNNFAITGGGTWGPLSAVLTASRDEDFRGIDDAEPAYFNDGAHPFSAINNIQQRDYELHRTRHGYAFDLGYQPDEANNWYVRGFEAGYTERYKRQFLNLTPDGNTTTLATGQFQDTLGNTGAIQKALRDEQETSTERLIMAGGKNHLLDGILDYHVAYVTGNYVKPYDYNSSYTYNAPNGANPTITYAPTGRGNTPLYAITGAPGYLDPSNYTLSGFNNSTAHNSDHETTFAANLTLPVEWLAEDDETVKVGASARLRNKIISNQPYSYPNLPATSLSAASTGSPETYYAGQYQNGIDIKTGYLQSILGQGTVGAAEILSAEQQYLSAHENIYAGYGQYEITMGPLGILAGLRFEQTVDHFHAFSSGLDASGNTFAFPIESRKNYHDFFPSLQARYEIAPDFLARATYSSTIARPGFNQSNPSLSVDLGSGIVTTGNPALKPATANSFDLTIERYLGEGGILSAGVFDKEISNYIVPTQLTTTVNIGPCAGCFAGQLLRVFAYQNVSSSFARGLELNWRQHFRELPGLLGGLGAGANYTYVLSQAQVRPNENLPLPSASKHTANASIFYDDHGLNITLGLYYVSKDLFGIGTDPTSDIYNAARLSADFGASYQVTDNWQTYFDAKNLLNTPHAFWEGNPHRPIQREFYDQTFLAGVRFNY